jgi:hypothetical protein
MSNSQPEFDAFLSYSHRDAAWVETLAQRLEDEHGFKVWLDKWVLVPGGSWQQAIAKGLNQAKTCVICLGAQTPRGWFRQEIERALDLQTKNDSFRVIPLLLPNVSMDNIPDFLGLRTWADFRQGKDQKYNFHVLKCGIMGEPVGRWPLTVDAAKTKRALPALGLTWTFWLLGVVTGVLLLSSAFFDVPLPLKTFMLRPSNTSIMLRPPNTSSRGKADTSKINSDLQNIVQLGIGQLDVLSSLTTLCHGDQLKSSKRLGTTAWRALGKVDKLQESMDSTYPQDFVVHEYAIYSQLVHDLERRRQILNDVITVPASLDTCQAAVEYELLHQRLEPIKARYLNYLKNKMSY